MKNQEKGEKRRKSLRRKLIWIVILAASLPILIFFLINYSLAFLKYQELLYTKQKEKVSLGAEQISQFITKIKDVLLSKTETVAFQNMNEQEIRYSLVETIKRFKYLERLTLYDPDGIPYFTIWMSEDGNPKITTRNVKHLSYHALMNLREETLYIGRVIYGQENLPMVTVAIPIINHRDGTLLGALSAQVDLSHLWTIIKGLSPGKSQNAFLVDDRGNLLIHSSGAQDEEFNWKEIPPIKAIVERTWETSRAKLPTYVNFQGNRVVGTAAHIRGTHWGLILEQSAGELFGGIYNFFWISLSISLIILLICILFAYRYFRYLLEPFDKLFEGVEAITAGDLNYRLEIETADEIQTLAESFNRMASSLEEQRNQSILAMEELKKKKKELEISNIHLKEASKLQSEFLTNISHELRTPMNTIIGYTSIISDGIYGDLNSKQRKTLKKILNNARNLSRLINDILDLSKLETGKMPVFKELVLVSQVIKESLQPFRARIEEKELYLNLKIIDDVEIETDRSKVKQVLSHLISNALKFTRKGSITLTCEKTQGGDHVKISVTDTGIGIKKEDLKKIFDEFRQLDGSFTREYGGTGLGLSITKKILKLLGGKITVKSQYRKGSTFTIYLPISPPTQKKRVIAEVPPKLGTEEEEPDTEEIKDITKKVILTIDDDREFLNMMKDIVKGSDFRVVTAKTPEEGLEMAKKIRPYLITIDIIMPDKDGWETIKELKKDPITLDIPIYVISIVDEKAKAYSLGVSDYFVKPIDRDYFMKKLHSLSQWRGRRVLVIDDDPDFLENFFIIMREHSFQITSCDNSEEGLKNLRSIRPDALILDLMLPRISGYDILDIMEKEGLDREIPVILITAKELTREELEELEPRVFTVVRKTGITRDELAPKLKSIFERLWGDDSTTPPVRKEKTEGKKEEEDTGKEVKESGSSPE